MDHRPLDSTTVGARIELARRKRGLRRSDLAKAASVKWHTVYRHETNDFVPSPPLMTLYSIVLAVPLEWLRDGGPEPVFGDEAA